MNNKKFLESRLATHKSLYDQAVKADNIPEIKRQAVEMQNIKAQLNGNIIRGK